MDYKNQTEDYIDDQFNQKEPTKPIYSARLIRIFSIVFSPIFGGVLFFINLKEKGETKEGLKIMFTSILFSVLAFAITSRMQTPNSTIILVINFIGGYILSYYFYPKYFNDFNQTYKKPWKPIIVALAITIPFAIQLARTIQ